MGQSTNAVLFYGYCWEEETSRPWEIGKPYEEVEQLPDEDWEARYARLAHGLEEPKVEYGPETKHLFSAFWDERRKLVAQIDVEVDTHCSGNCPMPYVCIKSTEITSHRGDATIVTPDTIVGMMNPDPEWKRKLEEFCKVMQIPIPDDGPKWYLVSYWS